MTLFRTVDPALEPLSVAEIKAQLRIEHDSEDALIAGLIRAARSEVENQTGMALIDQDWRLALDYWPPQGVVRLRRHPVKQILSVTIYGRDGEASLVDPADYAADLATRPARVTFNGHVEPLRRMNGIEIDFRAGFGEAGTEVPDMLRRAMTVLVSHWFEFRATFGAQDQPVSIPGGFDRLIASYRAGRL